MTASLRFLPALLSLAGVLLPASASGQETPPVRLVILDGGDATLDPRGLCERLQRELATSVVLDGARAPLPDAGVVTVGYRPERGELTVAFAAPGGSSVKRTVAVPATGDVLETAVLLAGNLVRDQVAELLAPPEPAPFVPPPVTTSPESSPNGTPIVGRRARPLAPPRARQLEAVIWTATQTWLNVAARWSAGSLYVQLGAGAHDDEGPLLLGPGLTVGAHLERHGHAIETDLGTTYLAHTFDWPAPGGFYTSTRLVTRLRVALVLSPSPRWAVFAGTAAALITHLYSSPESELAPEVFVGVRL